MGGRKREFIQKGGRCDQITAALVRTRIHPTSYRLHRWISIREALQLKGQRKEPMMVFTLFVLAAILGLAGAVFFGFVADAYLHVPVSTEVKVHHSKKNQQR